MARTFGHDGVPSRHMRANAPVYVSDLDGTLLQADATLSGRARLALTGLLEQGIDFTVATARSITSTREILGDLPLRLPVVCANGGAIYNYAAHEALHLEFMEGHVVRRVIDDIKGRGSTAYVSAVVEGCEKVFYDGLPNAGMHWYYQDRVHARDKRLTRIDDIRACAGLNVTTITFMDRFFNLVKAKRHFARQYGAALRLNFFENKYSPGWHWLSLHSPLATKDRAVQKMMELAGLAGRPLTVFGDELNDLPMFGRADRAVAVGNALPDVKAAAHHIIAPHTEDAVVGFILSEHGLDWPAFAQGAT